MSNIQETESPNNGTFVIWGPLLFALATIIGLIGGYKMADSDDLDSMVVKMSDEAMVTTGRVEELIRFIEARYVSEVNSDELIEDAFQNILSHLDPHSIYLKPNDLQELNEQMEGSFEGVGIESILIDDTLRVNNIIKGGPAEKAGLQLGDRIIGINDTIVAGLGMDFESLRNRFKSGNASEIDLEILPLNEMETKSITVNIDKVDVKSVNGFMYDDKTAIIKIDRFSSDTYREFMGCLENFQKEGGFEDLVIDLRGNPGGFLPEATKILNQIFKEKGRLLVYTQGRSDRIAEYKTTGKSFYNIDKVAILVDEGSASGSEIIAGAIQDWDRGLVIGRRTFGKGLVQEQYNLSNGGALRLTVAKYFTPSGRLIQKSYEDLKAYDLDIHNRIVSGELSGEHEMPILDSTVYTTKIEKRIVYGGGGIAPDIYVPTDSTELSEIMIKAQARISEYVFRTYIKGKLDNLPEDSEDFIKDWEVNDEILKGILSEITSETPDENINSSMRNLIKNEIARIVYGEDAALEVALRNDGMVIQSMNAFSKNDIFAELK